MPIDRDCTLKLAPQNGARSTGPAAEAAGKAAAKFDGALLPAAFRETLEFGLGRPGKRVKSPVGSEFLLKTRDLSETLAGRVPAGPEPARAPKPEPILPGRPQAEPMTTEAQEVLIPGGRQTGNRPNPAASPASSCARPARSSSAPRPSMAAAFTLANGCQAISSPGNPAKIRAFSTRRLIAGAFTPMLAVSGSRMSSFSAPYG